MSPADTTTGIVLLAHGSRDPAWRQPMDAVARRMREIDADARVVCAFLELTHPDLPAAVAELLAAGATRVLVVPMFLGLGRHAREDVPVLMARLRLQHPGIEFQVQSALGDEPRVTDFLARTTLDWAASPQ